MLRICVILHLTAAMAWLGHMFFWSIFGGPALKKVDPPETASRLRALSLRMGGLGWPALAVLILTGALMLGYRGIGTVELVSGEAFTGRFGTALAAKLALVGAMVGYQIVFGHRPTRAVYLNMLAALLVLGASVVLSGR